MDDPSLLEFTGPYAARYRAFLETITSVRPALHRYCTRMTGSILDGEEVVQETLFHAYRKLDTFDDSRPLKPWLFRIAHNRCIDFLRRREVRQEAEALALAPDFVDAVEPVGPALDRAIEHMVLALPPKERACVLLKDVLGYSLEDIADLVDSTVGGVKAALSRGRLKLASLPEPLPAVRAARPEVSRLLQLYVERFNQRDWDGLKELISADARLRVVDRFAGPLVGSNYFVTYEHWPTAWRLAVGEVDGEPTVVIHLWDGNGWVAHSIVEIEFANSTITRIDDYYMCPWVLSTADSVDTGDVV
ncbi:MAG: sigma-70 family RNA polymerase sigma factor [bacterium]